MCSYRLPVILALLSCVLCDPIVIRSGLSKDHAQAKNSDVYDAQLQKADHNVVNQEGFNKGSEKKFVNAQDTGKYGQESEDKKFKESSGHYGDEKYHKNQGANESNFGKSKGHKKNQHKSGFHNTYHKDESGSNSSYYDDSNDEADEYVQDSKKGAYGDTSSGNNRGVYLDRNGHSNQNAKHGGYNNGGSYNKEAADRRNYNQGKLYNDRLHEGRSKAGDQYGEHGQFVQEKRYTTPIYHTNYHHTARPAFYPAEDYQEDIHDNYEPASKKVITVYEDPRVFERGYERYNDYNPNYDSDRVHVDIRRPPIYRQTRFYNERPLYDDLYY